jgi:hypothetical protein
MKTVRYPTQIRKRIIVALVIIGALIAALSVAASRERLFAGARDAWTRVAALVFGKTSDTPNTNPQQPAAKPNGGEPSVELTGAQLDAIKIGTVGNYLFPVDNQTVGSIDFDEDLSVQVFPTNQGTILETFGELGANVKKDQPLYTIKSPDLIQAESNLIGAAATFELTNRALARKDS